MLVLFVNWQIVFEWQNMSKLKLIRSVADHCYYPAIGPAKDYHVGSQSKGSV